MFFVLIVFLYFLCRNYYWLQYTFTSLLTNQEQWECFGLLLRNRNQEWWWTISPAFWTVLLKSPPSAPARYRKAVVHSLHLFPTCNAAEFLTLLCLFISICLSVSSVVCLPASVFPTLIFRSAALYLPSCLSTFTNFSEYVYLLAGHFLHVCLFFCLPTFAVPGTCLSTYISLNCLQLSTCLSTYCIS